jgi:phage gpG-like protein
VADKFNFDRVIQNLQAQKSQLPLLLANDSKNYFVRQFKLAAWDGKPWKAPQRLSKKGKSTRLRSAPLVQSGKLRRALINSIQKVSWDKIVLRIVDVPYAQVHNEGLRAGRGKGFLMPKRQYVGQTLTLRNIQLKRIKFAIDRIWRG